MKCELCGRVASNLYQIPFVDDYEQDEDGVHAQYVPYNVCSACVPEEFVDVIDDGQQIMQNLMAR